MNAIQINNQYSKTDQVKVSSLFNSILDYIVESKIHFILTAIVNILPFFLINHPDFLQKLPIIWIPTAIANILFGFCACQSAVLKLFESTHKK